MKNFFYKVYTFNKQSYDKTGTENLSLAGIFKTEADKNKFIGKDSKKYITQYGVLTDTDIIKLKVYKKGTIKNDCAQLIEKIVEDWGKVK